MYKDEKDFLIPEKLRTAMIGLGCDYSVKSSIYHRGVIISNAEGIPYQMASDWLERQFEVFITPIREIGQDNKPEWHAVIDFLPYFENMVVMEQDENGEDENPFKSKREALEWALDYAVNLISEAK